MRTASLVLLAAVSSIAFAASGCTTESFCYSDCDGTADSGAGGSADGGPNPEGGEDADAFITFDGSGTGGSQGESGGCVPTKRTTAGDPSTLVTCDPATDDQCGKVEYCDGQDNNCNGSVDEGIDLATDPGSCGICGNDCRLLVKGAEKATCTATPGTPGTCGFTVCSTDYFDIDKDPTNGCEYYCVKKGDTDTTCDNVDDNCNGAYDEQVDKCTDATNCGKCGRNCEGKANAVGKCVATGNPVACDETSTQCEIDHCQPGWIDANKVFQDGCEYACEPSKRTDPNDPSTLVTCDPATDASCGKREYCDGQDNDCNGRIDGADPNLGDPASGDPGIGVSCRGSTKGECFAATHAGLMRCVAATTVCMNDNTGTAACAQDGDCTDPLKPYCVESATPPAKVCGTKVIKAGEVAEKCNGKDDDCDGAVDNTPGDAGGKCGSNTGSCVQGAFVCQSGTLACSGAVGAQPEACNGADDDCDGVIDGTAATPTVACQTDANCAGQALAKWCVNRGGPIDKVCASLPADVVDAQNARIPCDTPQTPPVGWTTPCEAGVLACLGGAKVCQGSKKKTANLDECGKDLNCDGIKAPDFDLSTDVHHCGDCATDCFLTQGGHIGWTCVAGVCTAPLSNKCMPGYIDCDGDPNTCERACNFHSNQELCNGIDDNCNCDTDENLAPPSASQLCGVNVGATGACAGGPGGVQVDCTGGVWHCTFPAGYCDQGNPPSCAATPDICDGRDNNCNGNTDENFKPPVLAQKFLGQACASDDGLSPKFGKCQLTGTYQCEGTAGTACFDSGGQKVEGVMADCMTLLGGCDEQCNGIDDDCDGTVDESVRDKGANQAYWVKPAVVQLGAASVWMFQYEASRPNATDQTSGTGNGWWRSTGSTLTDQPAAPGNTTLDKTTACSVPGKVPWFNVTGMEAQHSCVEMGGRLCRNSEWQSACKSTTGGCKWGFSPAAACSVFAAATCNLGGFDFSTTAVGDQDGLLPTAYAARIPGCKSDFAAGSIFDITGNLREITCPGSVSCTATQAGFALMGGAFDTQDPTGEGASCSFTFYNVDNAFKLFDVGYRCCFDTDPTL